MRWARADLQYSRQLAEYFAILKDNGRAFDWLENAICCGVVNYPFLSTRDPVPRQLAWRSQIRAAHGSCEDDLERL